MQKDIMNALSIRMWKNVFLKLHGNKNDTFRTVMSGTEEMQDSIRTHRKYKCTDIFDWILSQRLDIQMDLSLFCTSKLLLIAKILETRKDIWCLAEFWGDREG